MRLRYAKNGSVGRCSACLMLGWGFAELLQAHENSRAHGRPLLTEEGVSYIRHRVSPNAKSLRIVGTGGGPRLVPGRAPYPAPFWDAGSRCLWLGERLLKQFRQPAPNQTRLLDVFQEQGWADTHIDDPLLVLDGETEQDAKQRLHETLKNLNRALPPGTIRFRGDGTGAGVTWQYGRIERKGRGHQLNRHA